MGILKKLIILSYIIFVFIGLIAPIHSSLAQAITPCLPPYTKVVSSDGKTIECVDKTYHLLAPLPCTGDATTGCDNGKLTTFDPTGENKIGAYLNLMIKLFIGICAVLAVVMIVMGGIEYMTSELPGLKSEGKDRIMHAIFGLVLALGAWTLLNTINPDLLKSDLKSLAPVTVTVDIQDNVPQTPINGKYGNYEVGADWASIAGVQTSLPGGVTSSPGECAKVGDSGCTSLRGLNLSTINTIQSKCPNKCGNLTITGGTEFWLHGGKSGNTSHQINSPTVDLRLTSELTSYIMGGSNTPASMTRYSRDGISYLFETDHWHAGP